MANTLVLPGVPSAVQARRVFERSLVSGLGTTEGATSVGYNLRALKMAAASVRERLSQDHWSVIVRAEEELFARCAQHTRRGDYAPAAALRDRRAALGGAMPARRAAIAAPESRATVSSMPVPTNGASARTSGTA